MTLPGFSPSITSFLYDATWLQEKLWKRKKNVYEIVKFENVNNVELYAWQW